MVPPRIGPVGPEERDAAADVLDPLQVDGRDLNIFATLVRHRGLFARWSRFGGYLLVRGTLPGPDRELLILRTAWNCRAEYEWGQHLRIAADSGVSAPEIARVGDGPDAAGWSPLQSALLRAADEMHVGSRISDATWGVLAAAYEERQLIEICMVVGQYHLVAFTLNSLGVEREPGVAGFPGGAV